MLPFKLISSTIRCASSLTLSKLQVGVTTGSSSEVPHLYSGAQQQDCPRRRHFSFTTQALQAQTSVPERPKRPLSPWNAFFLDRREDILKHKPDAKLAEISSTIAKEWRDMDKSRYIDDYQKRREEYLRQIEEYENSLTFEQLDLIEQEESKKRDLKARKEISKTHPPTKPRNAYNLYASVRFNDLNFREGLKNSPTHELLKILAEEFRNLSDNEKQKYLDMQENDKRRYKQELAQWYEGIQKRTNLSKAARQIADNMRLKAKLA